MPPRAHKPMMGWRSPRALSGSASPRKSFALIGEAQLLEQGALALIERLDIDIALALVGAAGAGESLARRHERDRSRDSKDQAEPPHSIVLDFGLGPIRAGIDFLVPNAVGGLIFDADRLARHLLLAGRGPRRRESRVVRLPEGAQVSEASVPAGSCRCPRPSRSCLPIGVELGISSPRVRWHLRRRAPIRSYGVAACVPAKRERACSRQPSAACLSTTRPTAGPPQRPHP